MSLRSSEQFHRDEHWTCLGNISSLEEKVLGHSELHSGESVWLTLLVVSDCSFLCCFFFLGMST